MKIKRLGVVRGGKVAIILVQMKVARPSNREVKRMLGREIEHTGKLLFFLYKTLF